MDRKQSDKLVLTQGGGMPRLLEIMARLRAPDGCAWDREQTYQSIAPYTIEEAYEVADAIEREDVGDLADELGDLLLQVVYHTQMASEDGAFRFEDVADAVSDKMVRRHPHVFGESRSDKTALQQTADWETIKATERAGKAKPGVLSDVALGLPALVRAVKLQKRAARVGFDWPQTAQVLDKLQEEAQELVEARDTLSEDAMEDEFGDLLFVMANLARHLNVDPEAALRRTNAKFTRRFGAVEAALADQGRTPNEASLDEMDALWDAAKKREHE
ncbi:MAG: nucleoside triphosphate pyrophosphohydrolase [Pseudomonadota bacterium]